MIPDVLTLLEQTTNAEERTWILTDAYLKVLPPDVAEAALAATVPHWFDMPILAALLQTDAVNAERLYQQLQTLSFIEPFGNLGYNVHDLTRAGVLAQYFIKTAPEQFKTYSQRAHEYFKRSGEPQHIVEAVYHLLVIDHTEGISLFTAQMKAYRWERNYSAANNLFRNTEELVKLGILKGEDVAEVEQQAYYLASLFAKSDKPEDLQLAAKIFRPDEDISRYQEPQQLREFVKRGKRDFLTQKIDEAREIGDPDRQKTWLQELGDISRLEDKDYESALQRYNNALALDANDITALAKRGDTYRMMGKYSESMADISRSLDIKPDYAFAWAVRGGIYRMLGQYEEALTDLTQSIELNDSFPLIQSWAFAQRGILYTQIGQYSKSLDDLKHAIELDNSVVWYFTNRGEIYRKMGQFAEAAADLTRALELNPKYAFALATRGAVYRRMGRYEDAAADLTRAIELDPRDAFALAQRGEAYRQMGQYAEAIADLTRALELEPENEWRYYERGLVYLAMNTPEQAQPDFAAAIRRATQDYEKNPDDWRNGFNLALYHLAAGNLMDAERLYKAGIAAAHQGMLRMAINDLTDFLRLFPEHSQAQAFRARLQQQREEQA